MEYTFKWLSGLPMPAQVVAFIMAIGAIGHWIYILSRRGFNIGKDGFVLNGKAAEKTKAHVSPHKSCIHSKDVLLLLIDLPQLIVDRVMLENFKGLRQIMNLAEQQADLALSLLLKSYISLLDDKDINHAVGSMSYMVYRLLLRDMRRCLLDHVKAIVQENSYTGLTDTEFDTYATARIHQLTDHATDFLNEEYFYNIDVTRDEIYDENNRIKSEFEKIFRDFFNRTRVIGEAHKKEIRDIDDRIQKLKSYFC